MNTQEHSVNSPACQERTDTRPPQHAPRHGPGTWSSARTANARVLAINGATLSHMEIGVRDLRNRTAGVIDAVQAGERVTLTVNGEPLADIVPHGRRTRWLAGPRLREQLGDRATDAALSDELDTLAGQTLDEL
jgi:prevent-host-death family protein